MLYQNVVVSNKCVKELVGRTDTFFLELFWIFMAGGNRHHRETS